MGKKTIGFVGVGLMGHHMARHLLEAGYPVIVHDIDPAKVDTLVKAGGTKANAPDEIAPQVDVIMLSLPNSAVVREVVRNTLRLLDTGRKGLILIDTSTGEPTASAALAAELAEKGIEMLDTTVSGTSEMCAVKDVIFMTGGKKEIYEQCVPLFAALGKESIHMGGHGAGAVTKLIVNLVLGLNRMALAEGLTLAKKAGLDPEKALEVLKKSAAYSKAMDQKGLRMVRREFVPPASRLAASYKGARLMSALGARLDCPLPMISLYTQALASEVSKGRGEWDNASIINFYNDLVNFE